jgi:class 3 adenylate cyclase
VLKEEVKVGRVESEGRYIVHNLEDEGASMKVWSLENERFNAFSPEVLGLGDISTRAEQIQALAAVFDLSGFTKFCSQVDPHLAVPEYLSRFLNWLFSEVKTGLFKERFAKETWLWASLPFFAKFLGDGLLFLWDTREASGAETCNIVTTLWEICDNYVHEFYKDIKRSVTIPPDFLRCGISQGTVLSVGNGEDYVGPCINIAARLQKLSSLTFCVSRRGFDFEKDMPKETSDKYMLKSVSLRGIGEEELVWVRKEQFYLLTDDEKALFKNP